MKLAIVSTHPIQYNAPWFKLLSEQEGLGVKVFYTWEQSKDSAKYDPGFNKVIKWDLPLLEGYEHTFVKNVSKEPGSHHFRGVVNPTLNKEIENWGADVVLVSGWAFVSHLNCMKYFKGKIPVLFRGDSTLLSGQKGIKKILRSLILRYVYKHVDYALYVGTNNKKYFLANGLKENQLVHVPHAIDNKRFSDVSENVHESVNNWKEELGIKPSDTVVLFAGKFEKVKQPHFIIEVAKTLPNKNIKFVLVGNGNLENNLKSSIDDPRVIFVDFQNQLKMPEVYRLGDIYILPSLSETWGLGINEAVASGCYIIASNRVGCAIDMVKDNINGITVKPDDVKGAVDYIEKVHYGGNTEAKEECNQQLLDIHSFNTLVSNIHTHLKRIMA